MRPGLAQAAYGGGVRRGAAPPSWRPGQAVALVAAAWVALVLPAAPASAQARPQVPAQAGEDAGHAGAPSAVPGSGMAMPMAPAGAAGTRADEVPIQSVLVQGPGGAHRLLDEASLSAMPQASVTLPAGDGQDKPRRLEGPLLWTVLGNTGAAGDEAGGMATRRQQARLVVLARGRDGYEAVLALGELSPEFENKPVLLALRQDGQPLGAGHLRLVVPGDRHGARGVHDLARLTVVALPAP